MFGPHNNIVSEKFVPKTLCQKKIVLKRNYLGSKQSKIKLKFRGKKGPLKNLNQKKMLHPKNAPNKG